MPDDYWTNTRHDLLLLVERLTPDAALSIVRELVIITDETQLAPCLAGMIRGHVARSIDDEQRRANYQHT